MITVNEILNLTLFKKFQIVTGKEYLTNTVTAAVILEYESSRIQFAGYCYGYFVLASYFFASMNPELVNNSLKKLIQKHVSGIALKMLPEEHLPPDLIQLAKDEHVPIFTFYDEFMEDLIININESMKTRAQYIVHEEKLNMIMDEKNSEEEVRRIALEINPGFKNKVITATLVSKETATNLQVHTYFDKLMYHSSKMETETPWTFVKNGYNIVLISSFSEDEAKNVKAMIDIKAILQKCGFSEELFYIGYDAEPVDLSKLRESVYKSKIAVKICMFLEKDYLSYTYVGVYKYVLTVIENEIMCAEVKKKIAILENYDKQHESTLIKTLISYVNNNGDFGKTSLECFQHTNTIRYRIKKAEELLDLEENTSQEEIYLLIRCYLLMKEKNQ